MLTVNWFSPTSIFLTLILGLESKRLYLEEERIILLFSLVLEYLFNLATISLDARPSVTPLASPLLSHKNYCSQ